MKTIITCEHGWNEIPEEYKYLFDGAESILNSHMGYDLGALELAEELSANGADYFFYSKISRLLVDLNRSVKHPDKFSKFTKQLSYSEKEQILDKHYFIYRKKVEDLVQLLISEGNEIIHLSIHSFTPVLNNIVRNADIGLLYDPERKKEKVFASAVKKKLLETNNNINIRFNYPYLGTSDGLTSSLRKTYSGKLYSGIEIEVNQKFILENEDYWQKLKEDLTKVLVFILKNKR